MDTRPTPRKGQVWHIAQGKTQTTGCEMWSNRFAIIVSNDVLNEKAGFVNVVYLTSKTKCSAPTHVRLHVNDRKAYALCEQTFSVDKSRLAFLTDTLSDEDMKRIDQAILFTFAIPNTLKPTTLYTKWANMIEKHSIDISVDPNPENTTETDSACTEKANAASDNAYKLLYEHEKETRLSAESKLASMAKLIDTSAVVL